MKILIINQYFSSLGGAEVVAYNQYKKLQNQNIEVYFWACNKQPYFEENYKYIKYFCEENSGVKNYLKNPYKYFYNKEAKDKLQNFIKKINPNIIHLQNFFILTPSILECCKNIPTVMTVHDSKIICPSAQFLIKNKDFCSEQLCKNGKFYNCLLNKCVKNKLEPSLRHTIYAYNLAKKLKIIDKFITPSYALKKIILNANIGINQQKITVINNFLPSDELNIIPNYTNNGYFLYIGRLSSEKGVHYLLEAIKDLPKEIKLKIAGTGPEENKLKKYVKNNNLNNIEFLGFKNREEIKELYQNCISTILPCNWFEIFGMTNIESFINGKPVIASNIGGIPEIVEDNINGLLFEPGNVEQLKECILKYWNNPDLVVEHGKNGYQKAITQYTEGRYYDELMKVYEEVLNESK